ncbi:MAG TPA: AmmeMemoRadiSam system radical SAM enzyme [Elusimicrobiales bacterium]|nr:AmmeMemoRadiSam system radical SAM enzyme [Elusimicrobiales bacterium]
MNANYEIDKYVRKTNLCKKLSQDRVKCLACAHQCTINKEMRGICAVRINKDGNLMAPYGYVSGLGVDPIEKKPFFHFLPSEPAVSFGMFGCNFRCEFCQNYTISQVIKDKDIKPSSPERISSDKIIDYAKKTKSRIITSTYNEPFITIEWAREIFQKAKKQNMYCCFVSNGFASEASLKYIAPLLDACNVDLKTFSDENYSRVTGGRLKPVLDTIIRLKETGIWTEVITLVIRGFNDSDDELNHIAKFIAGVSKDIPWHVTAFYPAYKWLDREPTEMSDLKRAYEIGKANGLNYVYAGNITGHDFENTYCPKCKSLLVKRSGFGVLENKLMTADSKAKCFKCNTQIPGVW